MDCEAQLAGTQTGRRECPRELKRQVRRGIFWEGKYAEEMAGEWSRGVTVPSVNVRISMQDYYKPLRATVMICATLVNTQTHTDDF